MTATKGRASVPPAIMRERTVSLANIAGIFKGYRGRSVAFLLLAELFLAQLAIANPHLHQWMHGAEGCPHHAEHHSDDSKDNKPAENHTCTIALVADGLFQESGSHEVSTILLPTDLVSEPVYRTSELTIARPSARSPPLFQG